jgi:cyclopropane-fatty-acyl-phospholipid synthase
VLDIGCGWGSLARRLVEEHGVEQVVGLTLSEAQAEHIEAAGLDGVEVHVQNWVDHESEEPYDAIISIGAFEHFASYGLPRDERVAGYRRFFKRCRELLVPEGRLALQTCAKGSNVRLDRQTTAELRFIIDTIFPESELPWLSEIALASEKVLDPVSVRNDPEHYSRTCAAWLERLQARREEALELVGERAVADYERYLEVTVKHFARRHLGLLRLIFQSV